MVLSLKEVYSEYLNLGFKFLKRFYSYYSEAAEVMRDICLAVRHLHCMGIAHRDLKPENLLYSSPGKNECSKFFIISFVKFSIILLKVLMAY